MSESVIRIPSQQSLFNNTNNLIDLVIPGNTGVYDLSQSYVSLLSRVTSVSAATPAFTVGDSSNAVYDIRLHMAHQGVTASGAARTSNYNDCATPIECLVNRCSMVSEAKGGIEDIVKSGILRGTMSVYKEDLDSRQAKALTTWAGAAKDQPWVHGQHVQLVGEGDTRSREVTHEIRLQLRDLFDAGAFEAYDSSVYGQTRIHLELAFTDVIRTQCQGASDVTWTSAYQQRVLAAGAADIDAFGYTRSVSQTLATGAAATSDTTITMVCEYDSLEDVPFWVGQDLTLTPHNAGAGIIDVTTPPQTTATAGEIAAGVDGDPGRAVVSAIAYDKATKLVTLTFEGVVSATPIQAAGHGGILRFDVKGTDVDSNAISYEACELVATMRSDMPMGSAPKEHQFSRFVFQGDQFSSTDGTQRTYMIPANCTAVLIAVTNTGNGHSSLLGSAQVERYRFAIDGESVTNRAITYATDPTAADQTFKGKWGSSLHYDLLQKTFLNMGPPGRYQSMLEGVFSQTIPVGQPGDVTIGGAGTAGFSAAALDPKQSAFLIGTPIPMKQAPSQLLLELEGNFNGGAAIHIWSYVMTTV